MSKDFLQQKIMRGITHEVLKSAVWQCISWSTARELHTSMHICV